jgi:GNAT superfamily N-acetyltransferase
LSAADSHKPVLEKLTAGHSLADFDCGSPPLNRFLQAYALTSQNSGSSITYVATAGAAVVGYYSLVVGEAAFSGAPARLAKGLPRYPIPVMIIARLAVDRRSQGRGYGAGLLADAMRRTLAAAEIAGIRAVVVQAKDERAAAFYARFGFAPFPQLPLTLYRLLKDIRAWS